MRSTGVCGAVRCGASLGFEPKQRPNKQCPFAGSLLVAVHPGSLGNERLGGRNQGARKDGRDGTEDWRLAWPSGGFQLIQVSQGNS